MRYTSSTDNNSNSNSNNNYDNRNKDRHNRKRSNGDSKMNRGSDSRDGRVDRGSDPGNGRAQNGRKRRRMMHRRNRRRRMIRMGIFSALVLCIAVAAGFFVWNGRGADYSQAASYERTHFSKDIFRGNLFAKDLCVTDADVDLDGYTTDPNVHAAGLFDLTNHKVLYADKLYDRIFPASTTKIMTAYLALKYGNPDDMVTVNSDVTDFAPDEQVCGLKAGDTLSLHDLLCGLLLYSGNDAAVAIADYIGGSVPGFADMMNKEAVALGATGTHFVNPNGLQDENHYTTAYDLYLMFNACIKDQRFLDIISQHSYTASIKGADGTVRTATWTPTNFYSAGEATPPSGVKVIGGKTGTTDEAGSCVILYSEDVDKHPYISIIMGAEDKTTLYDDMTKLLAAGITPQQQP